MIKIFIRALKSARQLTMGLIWIWESSHAYCVFHILWEGGWEAGAEREREREIHNMSTLLGRENYRIQTHLSFIQHQNHEIKCNLKITLSSWFDIKTSFKDLDSNFSRSSKMNMQQTNSRVKSLCWMDERYTRIWYFPLSYRFMLRNIPQFNNGTLKDVNMEPVGVGNTKGHFTHEPRVVTIKLWEPKESVQRPSHETSKSM